MNSEKEARLQAILQKTKRLFLQDAAVRLAAAAQSVERWRESSIDMERLGDELHACAHTLKGVALTVGCAEVHRLAENIVSLIIYQGPSWTEEAMEETVEWTRQLQLEVTRLADETDASLKPGTI